MKKNMLIFFKKSRCIFFTFIARAIYKDFGASIRCHGLVILRNCNLGANLHFNGAKVYGGGHVEIGDNFHSGKGLQILTSNHDFNTLSLPYGREVVHKNVCIGRNVWIGMGVLILPGVSIGHGAIIQAGAVVGSDIPPLSIAGGNPARVFKMRDEELYYKADSLKNYI